MLFKVVGSESDQKSDTLLVKLEVDDDGLQLMMALESDPENWNYIGQIGHNGKFKFHSDVSEDLGLSLDDDNGEIELE
jgi:hypothetical protein